MAKVVLILRTNGLAYVILLKYILPKNFKMFPALLVFSDRSLESWYMLTEGN